MTSVWVAADISNEIVVCGMELAKDLRLLGRMAG